eukprot:2883843-Prymnesium_polylepis.1
MTARGNVQNFCSFTCALTSVRGSLSARSTACRPVRAALLRVPALPSLFVCVSCVQSVRGRAITQCVA